MTTESTTSQDQPIDEQLERDVAALLDLAEHIEKLQGEQADIKARLAARYPAGTYRTSHGVAVTVKSPSRTFNADAAWAMLTPEQQALCTKPDPAKIKAQLPGVLVDQLMVPGTGAPSVAVK